VQVFLNLMSNGVKYSGRGSTVTVTATRPTGNRVQVKVVDNGPGIAEEKLPLVFEPFERLGAERTDTTGTGLGLTLTKRILEAMGGVITVESLVGTGTVFTVELAAAAAPLLPELPPELPAEPVAAPVGGEQVVLYVEDNLTTIALIERIFAMRPWIRLITAMQGSLAMDLAREHHPRLIVLDLHLPDINGDEVLARLKADENTRDIPVIMLSADATGRQSDRLVAAGAVAYLTKPVSVAAFLDVLDAALAEGATPLAPR
jgi:CheY-like chemotaxis protein